MRKIILSSQIADAFSKATGESVLPLKPYEKLDLPVNSHSDMLLFVIDKTVFCYKEYYEQNKETFFEIESFGYDIIKIEKECQKKYPSDISLNVLKVGKYLLGNKYNIAPEIITYAENNCYEIIDVKQGYSACSTLVLDDNNVITSDKSIEKAIKSLNKSVLIISNEEIHLEGYNCGFIGGATAVVDDTVYFFGEPNTLNDYNKIKEKISSLNMKIKSILTGRVFDFGGAKVLNRY